MRELPLSQGLVALVDDADFERASQHKWYACRHGESMYARSNIGRTSPKYLHRFLLNPEKGVEIDHVDGNGLNNQRANLRVCVRAENARNVRAHKDSTSRYRGVCWNGAAKKWRANIYINGRQTSLGQTPFEIVAARVYDFYAKQHYGEFARLNGV